MPRTDSQDADLPPPALLARQSDWLAPARARMFRRVGIAHRRSVLDLGCGWQTVTPELARRSSGSVVAADRDPRVFAHRTARLPQVLPVRCDAAHLPFPSATFDLVFCQFLLLWTDAKAAIDEIRRVLAPGGFLLAVEPDYGGLIEFPDEIATARLWQTALRRAGADGRVGRRLPGLLGRAGFRVRVDLLDRLTPPSPLRFELLRGLPLTDDEIGQLDAIIAADAACDDSQRVAHLPVFLVTASLPG
jgi:SAM-dependent methyltransferase